MRIVACAALVAFTLSPATLAFGQTAQQETETLKGHIGAAPDTTITLASIRTLPSTTPLRVYLAFGLDMQVRNNFVKWSAKWNDGNAKKSGGVILVDSLADADVVLARYTRKDEVGSVTSSWVGSGAVYDPGTNRLVTRPVPQSYSYETVPVFGYILVKAGNGFAIVERYSDRTSATEGKKTGEALWDSFKDLMGRRAKAEVK